MLTDNQKLTLRHLLDSPQWKTAQFIAEEHIKGVQGESSLRDSAEETLKATYLKEGRVQGIREFIQELFKNTN